MAGCSIEDRTGDPGNPLYERGLSVERIRAARAAIDAAGSDFVLTARCEAYLTGHENPLAECLERLSAMEDAGADMLVKQALSHADAGADVVYACGMCEADDIRALVNEVSVPVNVIGGTGHLRLSIDALKDLGVRRVSLGPRLCQAAIGGFLRAAREVSGSGTFGFMDEAANLKSVTGMFGGSE